MKLYIFRETIEMLLGCLFISELDLNANHEKDTFCATYNCFLQNVSCTTKSHTDLHKFQQLSTMQQSERNQNLRPI